MDISGRPEEPVGLIPGFVYDKMYEWRAVINWSSY